MRYFYYRIYQQLKKVKSNDTPAFNALLLLLALPSLNVLTAMSVIRYLFNYEISKNLVYSFGLVLYFVLLFIGFKTLFGKQNEICKRYENETKEERLRGTIYLLLYIVLSVVLFFILGKPLK